VEHVGVIVLVTISAIAAAYLVAAYLPVIVKARSPSITFEDLRELHFAANRFETSTLPAPAEVKSEGVVLGVAGVLLSAEKVVLTWECPVPRINLSGVWVLWGNGTHAGLRSGAYLEDMGDVLVVRYWGKGNDRVFDFSWVEKERSFSAVLAGSVIFAGEELAAVTGWREIRVIECEVRG